MSSRSPQNGVKQQNKKKTSILVPGFASLTRTSQLFFLPFPQWGGAAVATATLRHSLPSMASCLGRKISAQDSLLTMITRTPWRQRHRHIVFVVFFCSAPATISVPRTTSRNSWRPSAVTKNSGTISATGSSINAFVFRRSGRQWAATFLSHAAASCEQVHRGSGRVVSFQESPTLPSGNPFNCLSANPRSTSAASTSFGGPSGYSNSRAAVHQYYAVKSSPDNCFEPVAIREDRSRMRHFARARPISTPTFVTWHPPAVL